MIRRPPRSTLSSSSAASDVYKRQPVVLGCVPSPSCRLRPDRNHARRCGPREMNANTCGKVADLTVSTDLDGYQDLLTWRLGWAQERAALAIDLWCPDAPGPAWNGSSVQFNAHTTHPAAGGAS